jgi:hypothetical protein
VQQPAWSLQQLCNVLGQQQADAVWQQILNTAGTFVSSQAVGKRRCCVTLAAVMLPHNTSAETKKH